MMFPFNVVFIPDAVITSTCLNTFLPFQMQQTKFAAAHTVYVKSSGDIPTLLKGKVYYLFMPAGGDWFPY